jgi:hypothetical protein
MDDLYIDTITQKKRERDAPTDVTFEVDVDERVSLSKQSCMTRNRLFIAG